MSLKLIAREPLLHFLVLASLLFVADQIWSSLQKQRIVVDGQTMEYLIQQREDLELRRLTPGERRDTIDAFVEDEILYAEAYERGLDRGDSRMRRNLILKMRGLLAGEVDKPTEEELRAHFEASRESYTFPATLFLEQVLFDDPARVPVSVLETLRAGRIPDTAAEPTVTFPRALRRLSRRDLVNAFGPEGARAVLDIADDDWHGPIESPQGVHFVRIVSRQPARQARYEDVKGYLEGDWTMHQSRKAIEAEVERLREKYDVVIEDTGAVGE